MRQFYRLCQLVQEQKGVLEPPELPPGYATVSSAVSKKSTIEGALPRSFSDSSSGWGRFFLAAATLTSKVRMQVGFNVLYKK